MLQHINFQDTYEKFQDVIKFIYDGIEVIVQFNHGDIDILLRSNHQCQDKMLRVLENNIVMHIKDLQSDPTLGCPAVLLEEYILRPACVQELTNCKYRKNQIVHLKALEVEVLRSGVDSSHIWKACGNLGIDHDKVKTLLGGEAWKNLLERRSINLQRYWKEVSLASCQEKTSLGTSSQNDFSICNEETVFSWNTSIFQFPQRLLLGPVNVKLDNIARMQQEFMSKLVDVIQSIQNMEKSIKKMEDILLHEVCSRIHDLMAFSVEMQKSHIPKSAYLCEVGKKKLLTRLVPDLEEYQLHLMCENRYRFHEVANQEGCVIIFGTESTKRFLAMLEWGLKIATILTKIGAHVACGMGGMVPDFSDGAQFAALILDTPNLLDYEFSTITLESFPNDIERIPEISIEDRSEAQKWLSDFLEPKCKEKREIYEKFKLKKVRYTRANGAIAWICDACIKSQKDQIDVLY